MSDKPSWQFDTINGREDDVSNALIEMFEGDYNYFLAREVLQNAIDAHQKEITDPVKVEFSLEHFTPEMFPGYQELLYAFESAKQFWPPEKEKCHVFLERALNCLKSDTIPVLKISDYNTIGLNGADDDRNSPWYGLVKSVGSTTKHEGQGGSFGLGKGAPFAASDLRTLFYSTKNNIGENVFQGVAEIVSHLDDEEHTKRGSGSFGLPKQSSIRNENLIEKHFIRDERGLDIYVMGYKVEELWQEKLTRSILRNFWPAIKENLLVVIIEGEKIDYKNLEEKLIRYYVKESYKDDSKPTGNPLQFYKTVKEDNVFIKNLEHLGEVKFYFRKVEEPLNRVAMIRRSKMVIYSRDFRWHAPYAGVFICENEIGNKELRKMESPQHDDWNKDRYKEKGAKIEAELVEFVRNVLRSLTEVKKGGVIEIPGLHKYLPSPGDAIPGTTTEGEKYTGKEGREETAKEIGILENKLKNVLVEPYKVSVINEPVNGYGTGKGILRSGKGKIKKKSKSSGKGKGDKNSISKENFGSRVFLLSKQDDNLKYRLIIKSDINGKCNLRVFAVGEEGQEMIELIQVTDDTGKIYSISTKGIKGVLLDKVNNTKLNVDIKSDVKLSLKVEGYALQQ